MIVGELKTQHDGPDLNLYDAGGEWNEYPEGGPLLGEHHENTRPHNKQGNEDYGTNV
jgi:hypothetical protein